VKIKIKDLVFSAYSDIPTYVLLETNCIESIIPVLESYGHITELMLIEHLKITTQTGDIFYTDKIMYKPFIISEEVVPTDLINN